MKNAKANANTKYDNKTYQKELFALRKDEDAEIITAIRIAKDEGKTKREWLSELFEKGKENEELIPIDEVFRLLDAYRVHPQIQRNIRSSLKRE